MSSKEITLSLDAADLTACCEPQILQLANPVEVQRQVTLLSALADPTRLGIVSMLAGLDEPLCVCDIVAQFRLGQPTISHHLKVLRDANLVLTEKRGLWVYYSVNRPVLDSAARYLGGLVVRRAVRAGV